MKAVGYIRVSTTDQAEGGHSLEGQKRAIGGEVERRGWQLADLAFDMIGATRRSKRRPEFERMLDQLDNGEYEALIVARLDRAWRSVGHFAQTLDRANSNGWVLVVMHPPVDLTDPYGKAMAQTAAVWAELEAALTSIRTSEGIRAGYASGRIQPPKPKVSERAVQRICELSERGLSHRKIAAQLTVEGVQSVRGGPWRGSTVGLVLKRAQQHDDDHDDQQDHEQRLDHALTRHL